jgi:hypothetical protein
MSLHHSISCESPAARRLRRCAPLLLIVGLTVVALAPGLIAGDRPFEQSLCGEHEELDACARAWRIAGTSTVAPESREMR